MNYNELKKIWLAEQELAHIHGWDFSHIEGRFSNGEELLPWDYTAIVRGQLSPETRLLDIDTGGGEWLLELGHPYSLTAATEAYPPNVALCGERLLPLGIDFREARDRLRLPFEDESFDLVTNRHGAYDPAELWRVLRDGGIFVTEQVGGLNDRELVKLICPNAEPQFPELNLENETRRLGQNGFEILSRNECFRPIEFYDIGALVWFARVIEWEFIGFSVEDNFEELCEAQRLIDRFGKIQGNNHRFLIVAKKRG